MLRLDGVHAHYGKSHVLQGVTLQVGDGEAVALLGRNGVGKTTTLKTIMGLLRATGGSILFDGARLDRTPPHRIPRLGVGYVPQGRRIFPNLTVLENLCLGLPRDPRDGELDGVFSRFPRLKERALQLGGTLSGGEQQMLAIARCLVMKPKLILLDEPSMGLAPVMVLRVFDLIRQVREQGFTILVVEQNVRQVLKIVDRAYLLEVGRIKMEGEAAALSEQDFVRKAYVGL